MCTMADPEFDHPNRQNILSFTILSAGGGGIPAYYFGSVTHMFASTCLSGV